jgi:hypothetical protein
MKRGLLVFFVLILLVSSVLVSAIDTDEEREKIREDLEGVRGVTGDFSSKTQEALEKDREVPENLQLIARIIFGLRQGEYISLSEFIVLVAIFGGFILLFQVLVSFFVSDWKSWAGSFRKRP